MKTFAIVGRSNAGKTRLIKRLIPKLRSRGYSVGVVKHCGHGFSLDYEGKDSWQFMQSESERVALVSGDQLAVIKKTDRQPDLLQIVQEFFQDVDYVLVEGGSKNPNLRKIEVIQDEPNKEVLSLPDELIALVSDHKLEADKPVFRHDQIDDIVNFLEKYQD